MDADQGREERKTVRVSFSRLEHSQNCQKSGGSDGGPLVGEIGEGGIWISRDE